MLFRCSWLPDMVTVLGRFSGEPTPIRTTVKKTISEFRRTHSDTWAYQKSSFSEEQLEVCLFAHSLIPSLRQHGTHWCRRVDKGVDEVWLIVLAAIYEMCFDGFGG
jgi:hypothetical protein